MSVLHVVFKVGDSEYALPASAVLQMETYTGVTVVPGARAYVAGIVQVRGRLVPVIDLRARFGLPKGESGIDQRLVVGTHGERAVALLVDAAREVVKLDETTLRPPPEMVSQEAHGMVKAVAQVGKRLVLLLDFAKVIGEG